MTLAGPSIEETSAERQVLWYGLLAFGLTWSAWLPLVTDAKGWTAFGASSFLHLAGGLGPALAAVILTAAYDGRPGLRLLLRRATSGPSRYLLVAVAGPAVAYVAALAVAAISGVSVEVGLTGASQEFGSMPVGLYWLANLVFFGYGEEIGWRGFALPRLQRGRSALAASMWIAVIWGVWHLPLFAFSAGLSTMPPVGLIGWAASLVTGSVVCTWLFNSSRGSLVAVALFHASLDIFIGSPTGGDVVANIIGAGVVVAALVIPRRYGREGLAPSPKVTRTG
jgi:membrane protease YdiL (CAAX protease family)